MWYFASTGVVVTWSSYGELQANRQDYLSTFSIVGNKSTHIRPGNLNKKKRWWDWVETGMYTHRGWPQQNDLHDHEAAEMK